MKLQSFCKAKDPPIAFRRLGSPHTIAKSKQSVKGGGRSLMKFQENCKNSGGMPLKSALFPRGTRRRAAARNPNKKTRQSVSSCLELMVGIEPTTFSLRVRCSTIEPHQQIRGRPPCCSRVRIPHVSAPVKRRMGGERKFFSPPVFHTIFSPPAHILGKSAKEAQRWNLSFPTATWTTSSTRRSGLPANAEQVIPPLR